MFHLLKRLPIVILSILCAGEALAGAGKESSQSPLPKVGIAEDGTRFVLSGSGETFVPWGFNYLGEFGHLIEDSWETDWTRVDRDFREMRKLGANVARIHLQFGTYMKGPDEVDQEELDRLKKMLDLGQEIGLYLDLTGLNCFRLDQIPPWYDALNEAERWQAQARFWEAIAHTCAGHPAVFCYDLMNEPVIGGPAKEGEPRWLSGQLEGFWFVQKLTDAPGDRTGTEIAEAWVEKLTTAIRKHDPQTPITVGAIPWAQIWPTAKPLFYSPEVGRHLDFVSIHVYPGTGKEGLEKAINAVAVYDIGKPIVIEETFPLACTLEEMDAFVEGGQDRVDGWIAHYFGHTIEEHTAGAEPSGALVAEFLKYWREKGKTIAGTNPADANE